MDIKAFWDMTPEQRKAIEEAVFSEKSQCEHKALLHRQPPAFTRCMDCGHEFPKFETSETEGEISETDRSTRVSTRSNGE